MIKSVVEHKDFLVHNKCVIHSPCILFNKILVTAPVICYLFFGLQQLYNPPCLLSGDGLGLGGVSVGGEDPGLELVVHGLPGGGLHGY